MGNMDIWNKVCKTDPKHTKEVKLGRKFTSIDPQYQIRQATETFGPFGLKWGVRDEKFSLILDDSLVLYTAILWFYWDRSFGEIPIHGGIHVKLSTKPDARADDDCFKKVATDALTKGLSKLGFNADVFLGMFEDNKYVQQMRNEFNGASTGKQQDPGLISDKDVADLKKDVLGLGLNAQEFYKHMGVSTASAIKAGDLAKAKAWISGQVDKRNVDIGSSGPKDCGLARKQHAEVR